MKKKSRQQKDIIRKREVRHRYKRLIYQAKTKFRAIMKDMDEGNIALFEAIDRLKVALAETKASLTNITNDSDWDVVEKEIRRLESPEYRQENQEMINQHLMDLTDGTGNLQPLIEEAKSTEGFLSLNN